MFERHFIEELLSKVDLTELMSSHGVQVKRGSGKNNYFIASWCCHKKDFDNGRINKDLNTYKCMSCMPAQGIKGKNAIHFLREYAGLSYYEAVRKLCALASMDMPVTKQNKGNEAEKRKELALQLTVDFYEQQRDETDYLLSRGISREVLMKVRAGYAPGGRVLRNYLESKGFTKDELLQWNLINHKGMDSFFRRAVIPIYINRRIVDIYGRSVTASNKVKHFYLYGDHVFGGIDDVNGERYVNIFESRIDQLVAESYGIDNGVETGGAMKFEKFHVNMLMKRNVNKVVLWFDGDAAGQDGALAAGELLSEKGVEVRVVQLPEDRDVAKILLEDGFHGILPYSKKNMLFAKFKAFKMMDTMEVSYIEEYLANKKGAVTV